jgi:hypothetical protein
MDPTRSRGWIALALCCAALPGCGGPGQGVSRARGPSSGASEPEPDGATVAVDAAPEEPRPGGTRAIAEPATFAGLVSAASTIDDRGEPDSGHDCLLGPPARPGWPWIFEADVSAAVRPLPAPPDDLDPRLSESPAPVLVVTRWGQIGARTYELALAAFTNAPPLPGRPATVVVATNRGAYVRHTDRLVSGGQIEPIEASAVAERVAAAAEPGQLVYVTAEAGIGLDRLRRLLAVVPESSPVALAVALREEIRIPDPPAPLPDRQTGLCPAGLPALPRGAARGQLEQSLVVGALGPLRAAVRDCMSTAAGTRAAGGLVELTLRIGPDGAVTDACLLSDELGGTPLRDCLIRAARATRFPQPMPAGSVDLALPLRLQPSYQRALCE